MPDPNSGPGTPGSFDPREPSFGRGAPESNQRPAPGWERDVIEKLLFAALKEQRLARRWGIFFKLVGFGYLTLMLIYLIASGIKGGEAEIGSRHTALVSLEGVIDAQGQASAEKIDSALDTAFKDSGTAGVILRVNSPGGSPVQAGMINDDIRRLRKLYPDKPLYVVAEEICASGCYYLAAAADKIYVDKASIIGSIGVLMDGFGFTGAMDKFGVERRLITAGRNKGIGDPFSPQSDEQKAYLQSTVEEIHKQFIQVVRDGRGKRLKEDPDLFSGLFWTGSKSIELGLADGYGTVDSVARDVIKAEDIVDYTEKESLSERFARRLGSAFFGALPGVLGMNASMR